MANGINNIQKSLVLGQYVQISGNFPTRDADESTFDGGYALGFIRTAGFALGGSSQAALASGQPLPISQNTALFSILGTQYGGDGRTHFELPDLQGRVSIDDGAALPGGLEGGSFGLPLLKSNLPPSVGGASLPLDNKQPYLTVKWVIRISAEGYDLAGELAQFAGTFAPGGFLEAAGQTLAIADYPDLYAKLGTIYGGDGVTTFKLPDMTGRTAVGASADRPVGTYFGSDTIQITNANLPTERGGAGEPIDTRAPSLAVNYYMAVQGIYPYSATGLSSEGVSIGEIRAFAGAPPSSGWIALNGGTLPINQNSALYSLLGTAFGGDGGSRFGVPDLRDRAVIGSSAEHPVGQTLGLDSVYLTEADLPLFRPINTAPATVDPGSDYEYAFNGAISVADQDTASLSVTLSVTMGLLSIDGGPQTATIALSGPISQLNAELAKLVYTRTLGQTGVDQLTITTSDGSAADVDTVAIGAPRPAPTIDEGQVFSAPENQLTIGSVAASHPEGAALTYALATGADATADNALVSIDPTTGALTFKSAPDFEALSNTQLTISVVVSDAAGAKSVPRQVTVEVTDVNDAPSITYQGGAAAATVEVAENATAVAVLTATDQDAGSSLTWSLSGADADKFTIDAGTGALAFISAPDFETPASADGSDTYRVVVQVSDGALSDTQALSVTVTDVNDRAPAFTSTSAITVDEGAEATQVFHTAAATDPDTTGEAVAFALEGADAALFELTAAGALRFKAAPNFEQPSDADADNLYQLTLVASDGVNTSRQSVTVEVRDVNEAPKITSNGGQATALAEIIEGETAVTTVAAADPDQGAGLAYSIVGGADAARFQIDALSGALRFAAAPDFETPASAASSNTYEVQVQASDGLLAATQTLSVKVIDANDNAPIIDAPADQTIDENFAAGAAVYVAKVADADASDLVALSLGGADANLFTISADGTIAFKAAPDFEQPADADADNVYDLQIIASDGVHTSTAALSVTVSDLNEAPSAVRLINVAALSEDADTATRLRIADIVVDDDATGSNVLSLSGAQASLFEIDGASLYLKAGTALDHETLDKLKVRVSAVDETAQGQAAVHVDLDLEVANINEAPAITSNGGGAAASVSLVEGVQTVTTVSASDQDAGTVLAYKIVGGADAALFTIDPATGVLQFTAAPDFETPGSAAASNLYEVEVEAADGDLTAGGLAARQTLLVAVTDKNDTAPSITSAASARVLDGVAQTVVVYQAAAVDPDTTGETITFALGGADAALFTIDANGDVRFVSSPDRASPGDADKDNVYELNVSASDGLNTSSKVVTITVAAPPPPEPDPEPQPQPPLPGGAPGFLQTIGASLFVDLTSGKALSPTITLPDGQVVPNLVYETAQAAADIWARLAAGEISASQAIDEILDISTLTRGVAADSYRFFTGSQPSEAGFAWLIDSEENPNDLTDPYYAAFSSENRYINFAVNLGRHGEGRDGFEAAYGHLSFEEAVAEAYDAIIGFDQARDAGVDLAAAQAYIIGQRDYFAALGGDELGAKAAMVGYVLSLGAAFDVGRYYQDAYGQLADQIGLVGGGAMVIDAI